MQNVFPRSLNKREERKKAIEEVYGALGDQHGGLAGKVFRQEATPQEEREFREEQRELLGGGDTDPEEDPA